MQIQPGDSEECSQCGAAARSGQGSWAVGRSDHSPDRGLFMRRFGRITARLTDEARASGPIVIMALLLSLAGVAILVSALLALPLSAS
jgi:hypothetical protein